MAKNIFTFIMMLLSLTVLAQKGGNNLYGFLNNFNTNATMAAFGMDFLTEHTDNLNIAITNPSLLSDRINNDASLTYTDIFAGISQYSGAYSHTFKTFGSFGFGLQYLDYGSFTRTEANEQTAGSFRASDFLFMLSWGRQLDENVSIGAAIKPIVSQYETYSAFAFAFDVAATYVGTSRSWGVSLMLRNFGTQLKSLYGQTETMPFDISIAASKKLAHAPITFYGAITDLNTWNLRYEDPVEQANQTDMEGNIVNKENEFLNELDNAFRHLLAGLNIRPSKYFDISLGYSWRRNREMSIGDSFSLAGFSYGLNVHIKNFTLSYARNEYHRYGSPNYITLSVKL